MPRSSEYACRRAGSVEKKLVKKLQLNSLGTGYINPQDYGAVYRQRARFGSADISNK